MPDCIFCKIIAGEISADKIYEDDLVLAFMDIQPVSRGHVLVIPKTHRVNILDADDEMLEGMMPRVKKIARATVAATQAEGFNLGVSNGEHAGQTVFHLHFHVIPRYKKDGLSFWEHRKSEPKTRAELAAEIKKHL